MKTYVIATGVFFALVVAAHIARVAAEGLHLLTQPTFVITSMLSVGLTIWSWRLFRQFSRPTEKG